MASHKKYSQTHIHCCLNEPYSDFMFTKPIYDRRKRPIEDARSLRRRQTKAEEHLWQYLRNRQLCGFKFRRQVPFGPFVADFLCAEAQLIIELDGRTHVGREQYDRKRTAYLESHGYSVMRFPNHAVFHDLDRVLLKIS